MAGTGLSYLKSLRFTVVLIGAVAVLCLLGVAVPQQGTIAPQAFTAWQQAHPRLVGLLEWTGLTDLYTSPLMIGLWGLFFLHLLLVMADRVPVLWRQCRTVRIPADGSFVTGYRDRAELTGASLDDTAAVLRERGYTVFRDGGGLAASRNRYSPLGTALFHLSFILLLAGGVLTVYTRFRAEADVAVGEEFSGGYTKVFTRPVIGTVPAVRFTVRSVKPVYYRRTVPVDLAVDLDTRSGPKRIGINRPYDEGGLSFLIRSIDVVSLFVVTDRSGRELDGAYVKLKVLAGDEDRFRMLGSEYRARFHTDISAERGDGGPRGAVIAQGVQQQAAANLAQSREIVDPALEITPLGGTTHTTLLRPGQALTLADGRQLVWKGLDYWVEFYVGYERGLAAVYAAFVLMSLALFVRFGLHRRDVRAFSANGTLLLAGRAEYFPCQFSQEFAALVDALRRPRAGS